MKRQALGIAVSRIVGSGLQAITLVLLGRAADVRDFGMIMAFVGVASIANLCMNFGVTNLTSKSHARRDDATTAAALRFNILSAAVGSVVLFSGALLVGGAGPFGLGLGLLAISIAVENNSNTLSSLPLAEGKTFQATASFLIRRVLALFGFVTLGLLLEIEPSLAYGASMLVGVVVGQLYLRWTVNIPKIADIEKRVDFRLLIRRSFPFFLANLGMQLKSLDTTIVALIASPHAAGLYSAAAKVTQPFLFVPTALTQVILPNSAKMSRTRARSVGRKCYGLTLGLLGTAIPVVLLGEQIMVLLFGSEYSGTGVVFTFTLLGMPFFALSSSLGALLQGQDEERFVARNGVTFSVVLLVLVAAGSALWGANGAAAMATAVLLTKSSVLAFRLESRRGGQ